MAIDRHAVIKEDDSEQALVAVDMNIDQATKAFNWILFKDQSTGTLRRLTIDNNKIKIVTV